MTGILIVLFGIVVILPNAVVYGSTLALAIMSVRSRSVLALVALVIVSSPLWLFWPLAHLRHEGALNAWRQQFFFPAAPVSDVGELTIAGDRMNFCKDPCTELLLNRRVDKITLWFPTPAKSPWDSARPLQIRTVTANIGDECRALMGERGRFKSSAVPKMWHACFSYQPADAIPDGHILFVGDVRSFAIEARHQPPVQTDHMFRYQAFRKHGERLDEIAYSAQIRTDRLVFPPVLSLLTRGFEHGRAFDFGDEQGTLRILNRMFALSLTGSVRPTE